MKNIKAIGFDLFNTLIVAQKEALIHASDKLIASLLESGFDFEEKKFRDTYRQAALDHILAARKNGKETHNKFWICKTLQILGYDVTPEDPRISRAVTAYFSPFFEHCHLVPHTLEMLQKVSQHYSVGLLSNFTHAPVAKKLLKLLGLSEFFKVILISGELGYRKPHPSVFRELVEGLGVETQNVAYVGDDPEPDIDGAGRAGLQPIWFTYARDHHIPLASSVLVSGQKEPTFDAPRVSDWEDFLAYLASL